ncbi:MAG: phosphatidylserine decarboxylase [Verrucomicrobiales bacterium]|nr:phosphatidylserine decarboxylase [Verrucomicrobiales bacterium]
MKQGRERDAELADGRIDYFDRYAGVVKTEKIYGEAYLRWAYETVPGRLMLAAVVKRAFFSRWYGWRMDKSSTRELIAPFIDQYDLDAGEFVDKVENFESFNAFFSRKLKPQARPIASGEGEVVFPADGRHLGFADVSEMERIYCKGQTLSLVDLLDDEDLASRYEKGSLVISRLCPVDYHRFHFSTAGKPGAWRLINGPLYSVSPIALRRNVGILTENKRVVTKLQTEDFGQVLILEIGATNVGSIHQTYAADSEVVKGEEKGYFSFGGSMTMQLFEAGRVKLDEDLVEHTQQGRELYARMGDRMGMKAGS